MELKIEGLLSELESDPSKAAEVIGALLSAPVGKTFVNLSGKRFSFEAYRIGSRFSLLLKSVDTQKISQ